GIPAARETSPGHRRHRCQKRSGRPVRHRPRPADALVRDPRHRPGPFRRAADDRVAAGESGGGRQTPPIDGVAREVPGRGRGAAGATRRGDPGPLPRLRSDRRGGAAGRSPPPPRALLRSVDGHGQRPAGGAEDRGAQRGGRLDRRWALAGGWTGVQPLERHRRRQRGDALAARGVADPEQRLQALLGLLRRAHGQSPAARSARPLPRRAVDRLERPPRGSANRVPVTRRFAGGRGSDGARVRRLGDAAGPGVRPRDGLRPRPRPPPDPGLRDGRRTLRPGGLLRQAGAVRQEREPPTGLARDTEHRL
ncbi:MAG: Inosine-uridine preferring nucleoside hydrolase, partial [uncultured Thermomicrobiales bacterium]